jgi:hypothetical protein
MGLMSWFGVFSAVILYVAKVNALTDIHCNAGINLSYVLSLLFCMQADDV